jgi:hypothetical protein
MRLIGVTRSKAIDISCVVENRNGRPESWKLCVKLHLPFRTRDLSFYEAGLSSLHAMHLRDLQLRFLWVENDQD